jgi:hypothetical protein
MLTFAVVEMRAMVQPKGARPLWALVPVLEMFSLLIMREAMLFW